MYLLGRVVFDGVLVRVDVIGVVEKKSIASRNVDELLRGWMVGSSIGLLVKYMQNVIGNQ